MKPLRLVLQAFGPFAGTEEIDLQPLTGGALLLICGPTGGGKTTLIDAMAYALYGEACSEERDGKGSRSHFAAPEVRTEITFDFALGTQRYRVWRSPDQEQPKKKGSGVTWRKAEATLWRCLARDALLTLSGKEIVATGPSQVSGKIRELLGFDCTQFRQVIVLPQGDFRKLLTANAEDRTKLFERLFGTEAYRLIEEQLKSLAREIKLATTEERATFHAILTQAGVSTREALAAEQADTVAKLTSSHAWQRQLDDAAEDARQTLAAAHVIEARMAEAEAARAVWTGLFAQRERMEGIAVMLERARRAEPLLAYETAVTQRERERDTLESRWTEADQRQNEARTKWESACATLVVEETRQPARDVVGAELTRLNDLREQVAGLSSLVGELETARRRAADCRERLETEKQGMTRLTDNLSCLGMQYEECAQAAVQQGALAAHLRELERLIELRNRLERARSGLRAAQPLYQQRTRERQGAEEACRRGVEKLRQLEDAQREGRAALLAGTLTAGQPCPVCGSTHHPHPAAAETKPPGDSEIASAKAAMEAREASLQKSREAEREAERVVFTHQTEGRAVEAQLGESIHRSMTELEEEVDSSRVRAAAAASAAGRIPDLDAEREQQRQKQMESDAALPGQEQTLRMAELEVARLAAVWAVAEGDVPVTLRSTEGLLNEIKRQEAVRQELDTALATARAHAAAAEANFHAGRATLDGLAATARAAKEAARVAHADLASRLAAAGFTDLEAYREAVKTPVAIAQMADELQTFHQHWAAANDRLERAEKTVEGQMLPNLPALAGQVDSTKKASEAEVQQRARLQARADALACAERELLASDGRLQDLDRRNGLIGKLSQAANGDNARNLTFHRYVLGALLDEVLVAATRRLLIMSRQRFELRRRGEGTDGRRPAGLDLEVLDQYSGRTRPVGTLSGGEGFLAALSLALGLADVVQAHAGGVRMEAMFIDEGFGSLDPDALDAVFQALIDLQKGGRLIGIISHVEELKQRIDLRLEITAGRQGSHARLVGV